MRIWYDPAEILSALDAAEARVKVLEEALRPFAKEAEQYDPDEGDGGQSAWASYFTIGSLRIARAALASKEEGGR